MQVTTVEIVPELHAFAEKNLAAHHLDNVRAEVWDGARGWTGTYDVIVLTGSVPILPEEIKQSLRPGGRLFAVVGDAPAMQAMLVSCGQHGVCTDETLFETNIAPLQNAVQPNRFKF